MNTGELINFLSKFDTNTPVSVYDKTTDAHFGFVVDDISVYGSLIIRKVYFNPETNKTEEWALKK